LQSIIDLVSGDDLEHSRAREVKGAAVATVTDNSDPDGLGRVKLSYPWLSAKNNTDWVRIATLMAGQKAGTFCLPEVGTQVAVVFDKGDINQPIVIGSLWNKEDKAPHVNQDGKNNIKRIITRSGNEIVFDDTPQKEQIRIITHAGQEISMDDTEDAKKITIKDGNNGNSIEIDSKKGSIIISSASNITLKSENINIEGSVGINITAPKITNNATGSITSEASSITNLATGQLSCMAGGPLSLRGTPIAML
jgi:uncharacterized protein involved in type VI secretion and phage assembly